MALPIDKDVLISTDVDAGGSASEPRRCNHLEGEDADISAQREELAPAGVSIQPYGDDYYCSYMAGEEFIKEVEFPEGYAVRDGVFYKDARFVYFNKGEPARFPESFAKYEIENRIASRKVEVAEFLSIEAQDAGFLGDDDDQLIARETLRNYIKEKWPNAEIIAIDLRMDGTVSNHRRYIIYIAGYNLPKPMDKATGGAKILPFATEYCPEWVLHTKNVAGEAQIEGWEIILRASPPQADESRSTTYLAIPREDLKEDIGGKLNRTELYAEDLRSKLGSSEYMNGDNPIRLLKEIIFTGADGVAGLECPVFKVNMLELPKTDKNCLAWVMREREDVVRARKKVVDIGGGYLVANGGGGYKYIAPTGKLDIEAVKTALSRKVPDREGYDKTITATRVTKDPVCSAFELQPEFTLQPIQQPAPVTARRGADDLGRLQKRFSDNRDVLVKLHRLGRLGDVIWARTKRPDEPAKNLMDLITGAIHEDEPVQKLEVAFTVDQSGSMGDDAERIANEFGSIEAELMASAEDSDISLARFKDNDIEVTVHFENGRSISEGAREVKNGLLKIAKNTGGGDEYFCDAVDLVLDDFERNGTPEGKKKILLFTDEHEGKLENADIKEGGKTPEEVRAHADALGVEIKIIFIAEGSGDAYRVGVRDHLNYLKDNNIDIAKMNETARMALWKKILNMPDIIENFELQVEGAKRLSEVSRVNRPSAVAIIKDAFCNHDSTLNQALLNILAKMPGREARSALKEVMKKYPDLVKANLHGKEAEKGFSVERYRYFSKDDLKKATWRDILTIMNQEGSPLGTLISQDPAYNPIRQRYVQAVNALDAEGLETILEEEKKVKKSSFITPTILILGKIGDQKAMDILKKYLLNTGEGVQKFSVALAMIQNGPDALVEEALLQKCRFACQVQLGRKVHGVVEALRDYSKLCSDAEFKRLLDSKSPIIRVAVAFILEERENPLVLSEDEDKYVIAQVAGVFNNPSARELLLKLCDDMEPRVREEAAKSLAEVGDESSVPVLARLLDDPNGLVVQAAGDAINQINERMEKEKIEDL